MKRARLTSSQILCQASELSPQTLTSGQAFRWRLDEGIWKSPLAHRVYSLKWNEEENVEFAVEPAATSGDDDASGARAFLRDYFRLDFDLERATNDWLARDKHFERDALSVPIRQMRQDPFETLVSFLCSQNNHVKRIAQMIEKLCENFGSRIDGIANDVYSFPTLDQLAVATEEQLRGLGFGYRAPYIVGAITWLQSKPANYLMSLREKSIEECRTALTEIKGCGLKVADCVALFSLDKRAVVPVDTHVWQVARDVYKLENLDTVKTLTPKIYRKVSSELSALWGDEAGWAHSFCFNAKMKTPRKAKKKAKNS
jgi:N-glycosylase/DNA lyase